MPKIYIPVTEYQLPDGKPAYREVARPKEVATKAFSVIAKGNILAMERFKNGNVKFTIFNCRDNKDIATELCFGVKGKRALLVHFDKLINDFWDKHSQRIATKAEVKLQMPRQQLEVRAKMKARLDEVRKAKA